MTLINSGPYLAGNDLRGSRTCVMVCVRRWTIISQPHTQVLIFFRLENFQQII